METLLNIVVCVCVRLCHSLSLSQRIITAGDPLDTIYLLTSGEVELFHDLAADGPEPPCPHKPIIEGERVVGV
jgi:hypothetical protein